MSQHIKHEMDSKTIEKQTPYGEEPAIEDVAKLQTNADVQRLQRPKEFSDDEVSTYDENEVAMATKDELENFCPKEAYTGKRIHPDRLPCINSVITTKGGLTLVYKFVNKLKEKNFLMDRYSNLYTPSMKYIGNMYMILQSLYGSMARKDNLAKMNDRMREATKEYNIILPRHPAEGRKKRAAVKMQAEQHEHSDNENTDEEVLRTKKKRTKKQKSEQDKLLEYASDNAPINSNLVNSLKS